MKKILLTTVAATVLSTSFAYAHSLEKDGFYVKGQVGWSKLANLEFDDAQGDEVKMKSKNGAFFGVGAGLVFHESLPNR